MVRSEQGAVYHKTPQMDQQGKYTLTVTMTIVTNTLSFVQYKFENFFADDHLSSLMLLDEKRKQLDYQFILWKFDTKKLDLSILQKMDNGLSNADQDNNDDVDSLDSDGNNDSTRQVEKVNGSACCTIF